MKSLAYYMQAEEIQARRKKMEEKNDSSKDDSDGPGKLEVLIDENNQKLADKVYKELVQTSDAAKKPHFMIDFDKFLLKWRDGKPMPAKSDESDDENSDSSDSDSDDSESTSSVKEKNKKPEIEKEKPAITQDGVDRLSKIIARNKK